MICELITVYILGIAFDIIVDSNGRYMVWYLLIFIWNGAYLFRVNIGGVTNNKFKSQPFRVILLRT